jgi:transposase
VRRARLILMLAAGQSWSVIQQALGCSSTYIARWQSRFAQQRLAGLFARHRGRAVSKRTPRLEARILAWTRRAPNDGSTHWSSRKLAQALGVNHSRLVGDVAEYRAFEHLGGLQHCLTGVCWFSAANR